MDGSNRTLQFLTLGLFFVGIFVLAIGLGMFVFRGKGDEVKIISATNNQDRELKAGEVQAVVESTSKLVDINKASQAELEELPGIGQVTVGKIVAGRPYAKIEDLLVKKAVGRSVFEKISGQITASQ